MKIEFKQHHDILSLATKAMGKPSVYVNNGLDMGYLGDCDIWKLITIEIANLYGVEWQCKYWDCIEYQTTRNDLAIGGLFFFENEEEQQKFYKIFELPEVESSAMYACTFDANGECITENT